MDQPGRPRRSKLTSYVMENKFVSVMFVLNYLVMLSALATAYNVELTWVALPFAAMIVGLLIGGLGVFAGIFVFSALLMLFYAVSRTKHNLSDFGVVYSDLHLIDRNIFDVILIDWRAQLLAAGFVLVFGLQAMFIARLSNPGRRGLLFGGVLALFGAALVPASLAEIERARAVNEDVLSTWVVGAVPSMATFVNSATAAKLSMRMTPRADWASQAEREIGQFVLTSSAGRKVNLFMVFFESTFDPARVGMEQIKLDQSEILRPAGGAHGPLLVPIFGGGSWLSEFAIMTGQTAWAFGPNAYNLNLLLEGRFRSSNVDGLRLANFSMNVVYPYPGYFLHAESLYGPLGVGFSSPTDQQLVEFMPAFDDDLLYDRTLKLMDDSRPNFKYVVTMLNHGPHDLQNPIQDYIGKHREQERKFLKFKSKIAERYPGHENYFLAFGDHQPYFAKAHELPKKLRRTTFWSLSCVGECRRMDAFPALPRELGIEFLVGLVLDGLGLPTGQVFDLHKQVLKRGCTSLEFNCRREDAHAFNWIFARLFLKEGTLEAQASVE